MSPAPMRCRLRPFLLAAVLSGLPSLSCQAQPSSSDASNPVYRLDLTAQTLTDALAALSRLTGQNIVYDDEAPYKVNSAALHGQMSIEQALGHLLAGTSLQFQRLDQQTLILTPIPAADDDRISLQPLNIDSTRPASYQPDSITRINHSQASWLEQPQSISRIPGAVLQDQQPRNLDDALRHVSGVTQGNTLGSTQDTLIKRGFGDNRDGSILRDGMPVVQGRNFNATTENIEVLKGPAALLYGIQDPGGVINVQSKTAQLQARHELKTRLSGYAKGRNGGAVTLDSTGALGDNGLAGRLILDHQDERYWRNYGVHRETLIAPSLAWYAEQDELVLAYEQRTFVTPFDRGTAINPATGKVLNTPYDRRLDEPFNDMTGRSQLLRINYRHALGDDWQVQGTYSYNKETYDAYQVRITAVNPVAGTLTRSMDGTLGSLSRDQQGQLELSGHLRWLGLEHEVLMGLSEEHRLYFRRDLLRQNSQTTFSYRDPVYGREPIPSAVSTSASDQMDRLRTQALYLRDSLHLNEQWIAIVGARFLTYEQYAGRGRPFHANTDIEGSAWVPSAGLVYRFAPQWSWYASYSESFKPNSSIAPLNAATEQIIDSGILPEQARAWETGLKFEQNDGLSATLAAYDIRKRNVLVSETVDGLPVSRNAGAVRSRGLEFEASGRVADGWELMFAWSYIDAWVTRDPSLKGKPLQNVPRQSGSFYLSHDLPGFAAGDSLRIGGGPRYVGERAGDPANSFQLPAYTVTDAFARYDTRLGEHKLSLQLNINNLFDRHYYTSSVSQYFVSMGDARQWMLSSRLEF